MHADRFTAFLDACVLGGALRRNILLSLAEAGLFRPRWSVRILEETEKAIASITKGAADTGRHRAAIERAFPEALVVGYEALMEGLFLPDPDDRHVLAAAIATSASVIVTDNIKDFPSELLAPFGVETRSADDFIADTIELDDVTAISALHRMRERFQDPRLNAERLIQKAEAHGLLQTAMLMDHYRELL